MRTLLFSALFAVSQLGFAADPNLLNFVMPDAKYLAGMDVQKAKSSAFARSIIESIPKGFFEAVGVDPKRDFDEILIASATGPGNEGSGVAIVRGRFDSSKITSLLKSFGPLQSEIRNGVEIFRQEGSKANGFFMVAGHTAIVGDLESVRSAASRTGGGTTIDAMKASKIQTLRESNDIWMITTAPMSAMKGNAKPPAKSNSRQSTGPIDGMLKGDFLTAIDQAAMGLRFSTSSVELNMEATAKTEKDAGAFADVLRFLSNMVQLNRENQEVSAFASVLDSMQLTQNAKSVRVKMALPQSQLEEMMKGRQTKI